MNDDAICFAVLLKIVFRPIGSNFSRVVDHDVPIGKLKFRFVPAFCPAVYDTPAFRLINRETDRVLFVIDDVHKNAAAVEVRVVCVELRKSAGEIVGEDLVADNEAAQASHAAGIHPPCLIV